MQVVFYNPYLNRLKDLNDDLYLSMQGGVSVWSALAHLYLKQFNYKTLLLDYIPKDEAIIIFHPRFTKFLKREKNLKNKILVATLADARNKLNFVDYHIVQNPYQVDNYSFFVPHFPQPKILPRKKDKIENISFKGEKQNLDEYFYSNDFLKKIKALQLNFLIESKEKWRDYSNVDIILAIRGYDKNMWIKKPFTKVINAWIGKTPIIVGDNELAYKYLKKNKLDFIEVSNKYEVIEKIKYLINNPSFYEDIVLNGIERSKEFSIDKIVKEWINIIEEIKNRGKRKSLKKEFLKLIKLRSF